MKRIKVILVKDRDPSRESGFLGLKSKIVDADTGEQIDCLQDFTLNVPLDGILTVDARMVVSDIAVVNSDGWIEEHANIEAAAKPKRE